MSHRAAWRPLENRNAESRVDKNLAAAGMPTTLGLLPTFDFLSLHFLGREAAKPLAFWR
jgi:hypothetical protein